MSNDAGGRILLRNLSLPARVVIAIFLASVGLGYFSALVQLHFQGASAGELLPGPNDTVATYHGRGAISQIERLLTADESRPFNGSGSMRTAFTSRSGGWSRAIRQKAKELKLDPKEAPALERARAELYKERDGERQAVLAWLRTESGQQQAYDEDSFTLPPSLTGHPLTAKYLNDDSKTVKIQSILSDRCVRCHSENTGGGASNFPLDTYERVKEYSEIERTGGGMSLTKLAQTTHVHLLGFSMLYGLTGLIFCFTSYHWGLKLLLAPLPLVAQVADISCWWLARFDPFFARAIIYTGGVVALGLGLQILLSLFDLFGWKGKLIVLVAILAGAVAGLEIDRHIIQPYLASEKAVTSERPGMD